jgi:hypothetical protein
VHCRRRRRRRRQVVHANAATYFANCSQLQSKHFLRDVSQVQEDLPKLQVQIFVIDPNFLL